MDRSFVRSRTNSSSSIRSPITPSHSPNPALTSHSQATNRLVGHQFSADQLAAGLSRIRAERGLAASRSGSIPATPAPTPNPQLHVTYHVFPEQLAAGIKSIKADEGYVDSSSFPATPAPTPYSPLPGQGSSFNPDQVAEGIQRLHEEGLVSGASTGQPPTPAATPGPGAIAAAAAQPLGIIPEHLAESINHLGSDEGLESDSNPVTPVPTPISPSPAVHRVPLQPEQLAAGIHRLKVEEGISSGGSSGFPSTPAPTPFAHHPGGVRPEDLAAGISRLSVIEEGEAHNMEESEATGQPVAPMDEPDKATSLQPSLAQYFGDQSTEGVVFEKSGPKDDKSFFDEIENTPQKSVLKSVPASRVDLSSFGQETLEHSTSKAKIEIVEQTFDDSESLKHRRASDQQSPPPEAGSFFDAAPPQDTLKQSMAPPQPTTLRIDPVPSAADVSPESLVTPTQSTAPSSVYATPSAELAPPSHLTSTPLPPTGGYQQHQQFLTPQVFKTPMAITSPLPMSSPMPEPNLQTQLSTPSSFVDNQDQLLEADKALEDPLLCRRSGAWIPNQATSDILKGINSSGGDFYPDRASLTTPNVALKEDLDDPIRNLVAHYKGDSEAAKRQTLTADSVGQDLRGLRSLIRGGCLRAAVNLTSRLLHMYNQGYGQGSSISKHSPKSLQIWFTRIALLVKLRQFSIAEVEMEPFGDLDRPDLYYQFYPDIYPQLEGSMVPFSFRILAAELPQYLGKTSEAFNRLYALLDVVSKILNNLNHNKAENGKAIQMSSEDQEESIKLWREREVSVLIAMANCAINQKDFEEAIASLEALASKVEGARRAKMHSTMGRVFLQLGDVETAQSCFSNAYKLRNKDSESDKLDNLLDLALLSMAQNDYESALTTLKKANETQPGNATVVNNLSACYLYTGQLKEGLSALESAITTNPEMMLYETPILNLCTMYELESSYAGQKKRGLLDLVAKYKGDSLNPTCLKL